VTVQFEFERQYVDVEGLRAELEAALGGGFEWLDVSIDRMKNAVVVVNVGDRVAVEDVDAVIVAHQGTKSARQTRLDSAWAAKDAAAKDVILRKLWEQFLEFE